MTKKVIFYTTFRQKCDWAAGKGNCDWCPLVGKFFFCAADCEQIDFVGADRLATARIAVVVRSVWLIWESVNCSALGRFGHVNWVDPCWTASRNMLVGIVCEHRTAAEEYVKSGDV